jgi:hypothetical protein
MWLQFGLIASLFLMGAIRIARRQWGWATINLVLGLLLLASTIAVLLRDNGLLER